MPFEIRFKDQVPCGVAAKAVRNAGDDVSLIVTEFVSSEDGDGFITRLEKVVGQLFLDRMEPPLNIRASMIDHILLILRKDGADAVATVYINETPAQLEVRYKRIITPGEPIYDDDVADIIRIHFKDITIPPDAGVLYLFSKGWRKGLFYDFAPLGQANEPRPFNIEEVLGSYWAYLHFQDIFKITNDEWTALMQQQWFPFIALRKQTTQRMLDNLRVGWQIDDLLDDIVGEIVANAEDMRRRWNTIPVFADHISIFERALERFLANDYISATGLLYPRIEGVMRTHHRNVSPTIKPSANNLVSSAIGTSNPVPRNMLLPDRFDYYLREIYFKDFDPNNPVDLSRHTTSHGVAPANLFNKKAAAIGFLISEQLSYYLI